MGKISSFSAPDPLDLRFKLDANFLLRQLPVPANGDGPAPACPDFAKHPAVATL